jgi:sugar lactone lactonase YvrE
MLRFAAFCLLTAVFALPAAAGEATVIDGDASFPEGPYWLDGKLYYVEYGGHTIDVWDGANSAEFWREEGCGPSAVMPFGDGFLVTCYDSGKLLAVSKAGATTTAWDADSTGAPLVGPNDLTADGRGGAYVTTSGPWESGPIVGKVLHLSADGKLALAADDLHYANGIARSPDGARLYVNESEAGRVITFAIGAGGELTDRRLFVRLTALDEPVGAYPDGIKVGPDGNLYVGQYSAGRILVVTPAGELVRKIEVPSAAAPNLAFSADGKTIYVTAVDDTANAPYKGKVYAVPNE